MTCKGRLLSQPTSAKGKPFQFCSSFYVRFGLIMHLGSETSKSKSEAMFFPASLKQARDELDNNILPADLLLPNKKKFIMYQNSNTWALSLLRYLMKTLKFNPESLKPSPSWVPPSIFYYKDVDKRIEAQIYISGPLNVLLWGCEAWNLTRANQNKLMTFPHSAI